MTYNFDAPVSRTGTASEKWDGAEAYFGRADIAPLWVADMDFAAPPEVTAALTARARHPVYGYTFATEEVYASLIDWLQACHGWRVEREWILLAPGVVPSIHAAIQAFTTVDEAVIVQPPVYAPFFKAVATLGRPMLENPLRQVQGRYRMDVEHLEQCAAQGAKLLLLCSPHNPVARVWQPGELKEVLRIARRYGMTVFADEIHADLVYPEFRHTPLASLADEQDSVITGVAPSKTFNIPGLGLSALIIPDPAQRAKLARIFASQAVHTANPFSLAAFAAAYRHGAGWRDAVMLYLRDNRDAAMRFIAGRLPGIEAVAAEGTYLLWLDCRGLGMNDGVLHDFFVRGCGVGMSPGTVFGTGGSGFMRLNLAAPREFLLQALARIAEQIAVDGKG
ncbi:MAG TPA: PatB family C-S lyase [Burkholderiales bacterium]|nr:PatB family C-S lyase [Burkholderiales bacterium]